MQDKTVRNRAMWLERAALALASVLLAVLFALLLTDAALRWLRIDFYWGSEAGGMLMAWIIFLGLPMVMRDRGHIATDFLVARLPKPAAAAMGVLGGLLMLAYLVVLGWLCAEMAYRAFLAGARSQGILRLPVYYLEAGIVAGFGLMIVSQCLILVEDLRHVLGGRGGAS
jgi:TRAP-type C4-dicarboxylate transport system permease small subunit